MQKAALLFPGGGTQYVGMGKAIYDEHKEVREIFEEANDLMQYNLKKICFEGSLDNLSAMKNSQPAIFTVSYAMYQVFKKEVGITPAMACGHSLGEYAALTCAGALEFSAALQLVKKRGVLLQQAGSRHDATMMAVSKVYSETAEEECSKVLAKGGRVYMAVYNSEKQHVISGTRSDIDTLAKQLAARGADPVVLNINTPSHCPLMAEAAEEFREALQQYSFAAPAFPVISNVTGKPYAASDNVFEILTAHMVKPVRWLDSVRYMEQQGITHAIEIGPQAVLKNLMPFITEKIKSFSLDVADDVEAMKQLPATSGLSAEAIISRCMGMAVATRNYNTDEAAYTAEVSTPYLRFRELQQQLPDLPEPSTAITEALAILSGILDGKKTPAALKEKYLLSVTAG